jgi:hypothetical protein
VAQQDLLDPPAKLIPPASLRLPRQRRHGRPAMIAVSVLLAIIGALTADFVVHQLSDRESVLVILRDVPIGQQITAQDVTTTMVAADPQVATLPARELNRVIGMSATADLHVGELLSTRTLTDRLTPGAGQQLVPVALKPSRLPARSLKPGDPVLVVLAPTVPHRAIEATVDRIAPANDSEGLVVVDLLVATANSELLAQQAADGQISLILTQRRP